MKRMSDTIWAPLKPSVLPIVFLLWIDNNQLAIKQFIHNLVERGGKCLEMSFKKSFAVNSSVLLLQVKKYRIKLILALPCKLKTNANRRVPFFFFFSGYLAIQVVP